MKHKSYLAMLLLILLLVSYLASHAYIEHHMYHECSGTECPICKNIQVATAILSNLQNGLLGLILVVLFLEQNRKSQVKGSLGPSQNHSLYSLKVLLQI